MVHPQRICVNDHVLVAGTPGAFIHHVAARLHSFGWAVLWPNQDIETTNVRFYFEHNYQNFETQRIHRSIYAQNSDSKLVSKPPVYYDPPFPGPAEFIAQFDTPAVISCVMLAPFLDLWASVADVVIDIQATEEEDEATLARWAKNLYPLDYVKDVCNCQRMRYNKHLKLFGRICTITNAEVKDKNFDKLDKFLASICNF